MAITLEDVEREIQRRLAAPADTMAPQEQGRQSPGISLDQVDAEIARRSQPGGDPFAPIGGTGDPTAEYRTNPMEEAVQEAFPTTLATPDVAVETLGEILGGAVGTTTGPFAPVAIPLFAAGGAAATHYISKWLTGEPVTFKDAAIAGGTTLFPEAVTGAGRTLMRASGAAKRARFEDLAKMAREEAAEVFSPPDKELIRGLFQQVENSGVKVDAGSIQRALGGMGDRYDNLVKEVRSIDNAMKSGGEFENLVTQLHAGRRGAYDVGRLQDLRSQVRKRRDNPRLPFEAMELLQGFERSIDDAIYNGLARGQHAASADSVRATLKTARAGYARLRRTEELGKIVEKSITTDKSGVGITISLGRIRDAIRKGAGPEGRSIQRAFEHEPAAKKQFYEFLDELGAEHDKISVSLADLPPATLGQVAGKLGDWMATIYSSTAGQQAFKDLVISGHGKLTHSTLANLTNVAIRGLEQEREARTPDPLIPR